ncbi:DUF5330 domain-containing protein [Jiella marina]|uniref:DUF5330 domain-containing protein n=1 Tax=Jiella sp. LLJ827 TaxID=2917712 RepID=UPI002101C375|nr:DUF5330 domain-containing protein [Jiella sp. LLJ827]MCQ0988839.1 DUF5330 domain-containing protein [Jiella sp. LLJ827]
MIRFIIKSAFFLGVLAMIMPGESRKDGETEINSFALLYGAQAAIADLAGFCDRAPSACAAGGDIARFAGERVGEGFAIAYSFVGGHGGGVEPGAQPSPATPAIATPAPAAPDAPVVAERPKAVTEAPRDRTITGSVSGGVPSEATARKSAAFLEDRPVSPETSQSAQLEMTAPIPIPAPRY